MYILGISCWYHDAAAALIHDGKILAAAQEERFTRVKHDASFPQHAVKYCLERANIKLSDIAHIVYYEDPAKKFTRVIYAQILNESGSFRQFADTISAWLDRKLWVEKRIQKMLDVNLPVHYCEHHVSHAASSYYTSGFSKAACLVFDGVGEWAASSIGVGRENKLHLEKEIRFPESLGLLYSAITSYCGFEVNDGEYKLMGLAPYGKPVYQDTFLDKIIHVYDDGSYKLNTRLFEFANPKTLYNQELTDILGIESVSDTSNLSQAHCDLAASVQKVVEMVMLKASRFALEKYNTSNLCLSGGVALNCVANGRIIKETPVENLFIHPAASDAGGAAGAALWHYYHVLDNAIPDNNKMQHSYLGPEYDNESVKTFLDSVAINYRYLEDEQLCVYVADALKENKIVGWFQGNMEWGPRALGNRSILASPLGERTKQTINQSIKFREAFRPFAPIVKKEAIRHWFNLDESPYMLLVGTVNDEHRIHYDEDVVKLENRNLPTSQIPAVTHIDYSARVQSIDKDYQPLIHSVLSEFEKRTNVPVLVNTSFNLGGDPIVCSPQDAYGTFHNCNMSMLVMGNYVVDKADNPKVDGVMTGSRKAVSDYASIVDNTNDERVYVLKPNLSERGFSTNKYGWRCQEVAQDKSAIIFVGDSITFGAGINSNELLFTELLASQFPQFDIVNLGVPSYTVYQCEKQLDIALEQINKVEKIVLMLPLNDLSLMAKFGDAWRINSNWRDNSADNKTFAWEGDAGAQQSTIRPEQLHVVSERLAALVARHGERIHLVTGSMLGHDNMSSNFLKKSRAIYPNVESTWQVYGEGLGYLNNAILNTEGALDLNAFVNTLDYKPSLFLDNCHFSIYGHKVVKKWFEGVLFNHV